MKLPKGAHVAVADGAKLVMFRNTGDEANPSLTEIPHGKVDTHNKSAGQHHQSTDGNPADDRQEEDAFAAGIAAQLNKQVLDNKIDALVVIATPKTLGELRKHYHKALSAILVGEIAKDLTDHPVKDIERSIAAA